MLNVIDTEREGIDVLSFPRENIIRWQALGFSFDINTTKLDEKTKKKKKYWKPWWKQFFNLINCSLLFCSILYSTKGKDEHLLKIIATDIFKSNSKWIFPISETHYIFFFFIQIHSLKIENRIFSISNLNAKGEKENYIRLKHMERIYTAWNVIFLQFFFFVSIISSFRLIFCFEAQSKGFVRIHIGFEWETFQFDMFVPQFNYPG